MSAFGKRQNRARVLVRRVQRHSNNKSIHILCGKLKNNNHLLAKALSEQKQECESLYSENIQLNGQLQNVTHTVNKCDMIVKGIQTNNKEMLSMLVSMTNFVTNNILWCQELTQLTNGKTSQSPSAPRRESTRRLSTKSPARGVVKPMVSGHTIERPTINLRRVNMQRINNVLDLSIIPEGSPNTSETHSQSFTATNRPGFEGGRRHRMPERIPVVCVEADDEDEANLSRQETRSSERFSGRLSCGRNSMARKRSGNSLIAQIRSPRVSVCDVSKLLQNSHSINVRTLEDSRGSGNFNRSFIGLSTTVQNSLQRSCNINSSVSDVSTSEPQTVPETIQCNTNSSETLSNRSTKIINKPNRSSEQDPLEGPSWLHDSSVRDLSTQQSDDEDEEEEEQTIEIVRRKHAPRKLDSLDMQDEEKTNDTADQSMEITECINSISKVRNNSIAELVAKFNSLPPSIPNEVSTSGNLNASSNKSSDEDEQCANIERSSKFVTDRRRVYATSDDDDETIMLQLSARAKSLHTTNDEFRLSEVNCEVRPLAVGDESEPEVTTTIQVLPQVACPELPKIDDATKSKKERTVVDRKNTKKNVTFQVSHSSHSDDKLEGNSCSESDSKIETKRKINRNLQKQAPKTTKKLTKSQRRGKHIELSEDSDSDWEQGKKVGNQKTIKNPKTAKIVLSKLNDSAFKGTKRAVTPDQSLLDRSHNPNATNTTSSNLQNSELEDSSIDRSGRPKRRKAPTNLEEPSLTKKLRR